MQGLRDGGLLPQQAVPVQVVLEYRVLENGDGAEGFQLEGQSRGLGHVLELSVGVDAHGVFGTGRLLHQADRLHDIPGSRLDLVIGESEASPDLRLSGGLGRFHGAGPVGHGHPVAHLLSEEPPHGQIPDPAADIEQGARQGVRLGPGVDCLGILADELVGSSPEDGGLPLVLSPTFQTLVRAHPHKGDVVDLREVFADGRDERDFDFVELDVGDLHDDLHCGEGYIRGLTSAAAASVAASCCPP